MSKRFGIACILLGIVCLLSAAAMVIGGQLDAHHAQEASATLLVDLHTQMDAPDPPATPVPQEPADPLNHSGDHAIAPAPVPQEMTTISLDGHQCIGILSIPVLELELPILTDWSYERLKIAPCHYYGSCHGGDFVIAGHNYIAHFARLSQLQPGDLILFRDASDLLHTYEVVLLETLSPEATEAMITSGFDLSLFTCNSGGTNRITVRCHALEQE